MRVLLFDPRRGEPVEFRAAAAPRAGVSSAARGPRDAWLAAALTRALTFLGYEPAPGSEIVVGGENPGTASAWLRPAPVSGEAAAVPPGDFAYLCLQTHYRKPLALTPAALCAARAERADLLAQARALTGVSLEPSPRARAGYLHRFREALARDLDFPEALACVWDALRPGALSPGSRAALLREALPVLGLPS